MLAFALILALTAHTTLAKPTGLCLYPCDEQASAGYQNGRYAQPSGYGQTGSGFGQTGSGFGQTGSGFGQTGSSFGQMGSGFGQTGSGFGQTGSSFDNSFRNVFSGIQGMRGGGMTHGNLEDFGTVNVQPSYGNRQAQMPHYVPSFAGHSQRVESQVPVQPQIDGLFTHSSGKASYEMNNGYMKIHRPGATQTVISEPIIRPKLVQPPSPCQNYYDPCL